MSTRIWREFCKAAEQAPRLYLAPVSGAIFGVRAAWHELEQSRALGQHLSINARLRLFFAPLTGAMTGITKALKE